MIKIVDFSKNHIEDAVKIALMNYDEEKATVNELPQIDRLPDLECFADNGLGVAMYNNNDMLGFLCCYAPWNNAFNSTAKGTFSPIHAHGAILENRATIYKKLYQAAAEKWVRNGITYHAVGLYAHDDFATSAFFSYGFGLRCIDAIRPMMGINYAVCNESVTFDELVKSDVVKIRELRRLLSDHLSRSPCFMYSSPEVFQNWMKRAEARDSGIFIAKQGDKIIAFMEIKDDGENFATEVKNVQNICGAFCLPEYRGKGIAQSLLNYMISTLRAEGYDSLCVDFESFNPTASGFWLKYFIPYTNSVVRRIDECALHKTAV